jgi:Protein of unknown function (DUF3551)
MRNISIAILAAAAAITAAGTLSPAAAREVTQDRYCLQGRQSGYPGNCDFSTFQQCQATASGTNEGCAINPAYAFAQQRRGSRY